MSCTSRLHASSESLTFETATCKSVIPTGLQELLTGPEVTEILNIVFTTLTNKHC